MPEATYQSQLRLEPAGVAALIVPWNFPLVTTSWKVAPALAAGCTVVLKPSEITPLVELELGNILIDVGLPPGVVNIVTGDGAVGAAMTSHRDVAKISFTGSNAVGMKVMQAAAQGFKSVGPCFRRNAARSHASLGVLCGIPIGRMEGNFSLVHIGRIHARC